MPKPMFQITQVNTQWWFDLWPNRLTHSPGKTSTKRYSPHISICYFLSQLSIKYWVLIFFYIKQLSMLFETVIIQKDHNIPHHAWGFPDSKVHVAHLGPTWVLSAPGGPHVGPMNLVIRLSTTQMCRLHSEHFCPHFHLLSRGRDTKVELIHITWPMPHSKWLKVLQWTIVVGHRFWTPRMYMCSTPTDRCSPALLRLGIEVRQI